MVYDRALMLVCITIPSSQSYPLIPSLQSKTAAKKELTGHFDSPDECEKLYEESLWCLYALQDDLLQQGNPYMNEDRETIATCTFFRCQYFRSRDSLLFSEGIKRTKLRLYRCRARMAMTDEERKRDARADSNLVDVTRVPAPWDIAKPASPSRLANAILPPS